MYSREHMFLRPDEERKFWEFAIEEFAMHDMPTILNEMQMIKGN